MTMCIFKNKSHPGGVGFMITLERPQMDTVEASLIENELNESTMLKAWHKILGTTGKTKKSEDKTDSLLENSIMKISGVPSPTKSLEFITIYDEKPLEFVTKYEPNSLHFITEYNKPVDEFITIYQDSEIDFITIYDCSKNK
eukprot:NODE_221_length_13987_cov_0.244888.p8 type:complete len:142 gc:universal NODE_221_length_13987_cov_0.244888:3486-3911(+)